MSGLKEVQTLNIVEDCWKMISDFVYDGNQFSSTEDLVQKITFAIMHINQCKREKVLDLFRSFIGRLCTVLRKHGDLYNC